MKKRGVKIFLGLIALLFLGMLIFLFFAARSPKFQTKIAKYYTQKLSKKLDAKVSIDSVNFELFHHLRVNGIYVEDLEGDTLLYAGSVKTSILKFAPFKKTYNLSNSTMDNVKIRLHRPADSLHFNLTDLLASESPKDSTQSSTKKPLRFKMKNIQLNNFDFQLLDELKKAEVKVVLPKMDVDFNTFDLSNKILDANTLVLHQADLANIKVKENNGEDKEPTVFGMPDDWTIKVDRFKIEDGQFKNNTKEKPADRRSDFLFNNFDLQDLQVDMQNIYGDGDTLHFRINQLSFLDKTGFEVSTLSAETSRFQPNGLSFENLELITPQSKLQGDLGFRFRSMDDFAEFNERIRLTAGITTGELHPVDLDYLFKKSPVNEPIEVTGNFRGRVSSLRASDLTLKFEHGSYLRGDIDSNGLPDVENTFFDADIERLYTDVAGIQKISGKYNLSDKITKLGTFDYSGKFTGFLTDLVSYGNLKTDLGNFETDINYSKKPGQRETYKGFLSTSNFELGEWLDNEDLGAINFSGSLNGSGFDLTTMNADVDADVTYLDYQGERYTNLNLDGTLQNSIFDGVFASANEKVDAQVSGRLDYSGQLAAFDIDAAIKKADLNALGVLDSPFEIVGDFSADVTGETIDEMIGNVIATNVNVVSNGEAYQFDSLAMILNKEDAGGRSLAINSEKVSAKFIGEYNYTELIPTIKKTINNYYDFNPEWDKIQNTITSEKPIGFEFIVEENDELTRLFLPDINFTSRTTADGTLNPTTNEINAEANAETLKIRQYTFHDWHLEGIGNGELLVINSSQSDILNKNSKWLDASDLTVELSKDNILANIKSFNKEFLDADISLQVTRNDDLFTASILDSDLVINNEEWEISENNSITIGKEYWEAKNFLIQNGEQKISIFNPVDDLDTKLIADIENIDLTDLNQFINFTAKPFGGTSTGSVNLVEINDRLNIDISLVVDDLMYNNDVASITSIDGLIDAETQAGQIEGIIQDDNFQIGFFGLLDLKSKDKVIDLDLELFKASLSPFENLWDNSISDVDGFVSGYMNFRGGPKVFNMQGDLFLEESLGVTLDFTKARYTAEAGQSIKLVENAFLIDQLILKDKDGNTARVNGAITHTDLKDFTLDVTAQSSNFLFLDTEASDNPVFYGTAYAGGTIAFTGPVQDAFMSVVATSQPNTDIVIVAGGSSGTTEYSFIRFKEPPKETEEEDQKKEKGKSKLTMRFDLDVRPNANLKLQFEDEGYNTVSANGFGDLTINYDTEDLFEISGIYTINQGQYVVNLREVINEEFQLRPGGFVQWSGDPYEARINITADYRIPKADIRPLLASISTVNVGGTNVQAPATISIAINGSLDEPTIDYTVDVESGSLGSVGIDNVIRQINENKTELEQQVGLLLLAKRFGTLGSTPFEDGPFQDVAINTVSGLITKQFSSLLTEVGGLKNTTIDINYRNLNLQDGIDQTGLDQQIQLALTQEFLNNRVILQLGSDFNFGDQLNSGGQDNDAVTVGDIIFTYKIREDGRVLFRIFSRWDYDIIQSEDRRRNGFGFVFKKEFETFEELLRGKSQEQKDKEAAEKADRIRNREQNKIIKKQERQENRQKRRERKAAKKEEGVVPEEEN